LTLYSSTSPDRIKRTLLPSIEISPALSRILALGESVDRGPVTVSFPLTPAPPQRTGRIAERFLEDVRALALLTGVLRPTENAVTRKRSLTLLATVEVSNKPSLVAAPSSRWKTQRNSAPLAVGMTASLSA